MTESPKTFVGKLILTTRKYRQEEKERDKTKVNAEAQAILSDMKGQCHKAAELGRSRAIIYSARISESFCEDVMRELRKEISVKYSGLTLFLSTIPGRGKSPPQRTIWAKWLD